jgi:hypothetical protein
LDGCSVLSQGRYPHRATQTEKKRGHTSMPRVGFKPTIPVFERAKTFHALDRTATVKNEHKLQMFRNKILGKEYLDSRVGTGLF